MRKLIFVVALLVGVFVVLAWAARLEWDAPFVATEQLEFKGSRFQVIMGGALHDEDHLRIGAVGNERTALQSVQLDGIDAGTYRLLRYHFEQFPHTLELSFVFRRADMLEEVHVIALPWPGDGDAWFDLSNVPEWKGRIVEIGFAEFPTPQIVPPMQGFKPFTLVGADLRSRSWRGDFSALWTDWLGYWPWSQRSVHALGRDTDTPRAQSLVLCIAIIVALAAFLAVAVLRWRGTRLRRLVLVAFIAGWLLLDLHWHAGLRWRHEATHTLYAGFDWPQRELNSADSDVVRTAIRLKALLRDEPDSTRILVHASSSFEQLRLVYHLLPLNVAVLAQVIAATPAPLPDGSLIIVYNTEGWAYDARRRVLDGGGMQFPVEPILQDGHLLVMRHRGTQ